MKSLDHITINYTDYEKYLNFYNEIFLMFGGWKMHEEKSLYSGFGFNRNEFWISKADEVHLETKNLHVAFAVKYKDEVDKFYEIALRYGLKNNGKPGQRPEYHEDYYACFVLDDQNNNIECVFGNQKQGQSQKNFDDWNEQKKIMDNSAKIAAAKAKEIKNKEGSVFYHEREIVWVKCGLNVGIESDGKGDFYLRPALIIRRLNERHYIVLFCTTTDKVHPYYFKVQSEHPDLLNTKVVLTQIKTIDGGRIIERLITLPHNDYLKIKNECLKLVFNNSPKVLTPSVEANAHK